jgi:hypothetical protein
VGLAVGMIWAPPALAAEKSQQLSPTGFVEVGSAFNAAVLFDYQAVKVFIKTKLFFCQVNHRQFLPSLIVRHNFSSFFVDLRVQVCLGSRSSFG